MRISVHARHAGNATLRVSKDGERQRHIHLHLPGHWGVPLPGRRSSKDSSVREGSCGHTWIWDWRGNSSSPGWSGKFLLIPQEQELKGNRSCPGVPLHGGSSQHVLHLHSKGAPSLPGVLGPFGAQIRGEHTRSSCSTRTGRRQLPHGPRTAPRLERVLHNPAASLPSCQHRYINSTHTWWVYGIIL